MLMLLSACSGSGRAAPPGLLTSRQAVAAIERAGLPIDQVELSASGELAQTAVVDLAVFHIPADAGVATANIFSFGSAEQAAQYGSTHQTSPFSTRDITIVRFHYHNLYVMLFGKVPGELLEQYGAAIRTLE